MIQKAEYPSEKDEYFLNWGAESRKNNLVLANDVLGKIATLSATLLGGGVIFLNTGVISKYLIVPILVLLLLSLALSFKGMLPYQANVDLDSPTEIETHKSQALNYKLGYIMFSAICFFISLFLAVGGVSYKALCS